jgi:hypothetical protein
VIDDGGSLLYVGLTQAMKRLNVLLLDAFDSDDSHRRPACRFYDAFGIVAVVLVGLYERDDELRTDQLHGDAFGEQLTRPVMGRRTRLHHYQTRPQALDGL